MKRCYTLRDTENCLHSKGMRRMARRSAKAVKSYDVMDLGDEPEWYDQYDMEDSELNTHFGGALAWYNYNYTPKHNQDFMIKFMKSDKKTKKNVDSDLYKLINSHLYNKHL